VATGGHQIVYASGKIWTKIIKLLILIKYFGALNE